MIPGIPLQRIVAHMPKNRYHLCIQISWNIPLTGRDYITLTRSVQKFHGYMGLGLEHADETRGKRIQEPRENDKW